MDKVGAVYPYARLHRMFIRQTIDLGGKSETIDPDINQFGGTQTADRLVITLGKFSAPDIFDANKYAHDPRKDFLNWALIDTGTFDYAADAWAFTYGTAVEWYQGDWTYRVGLFDLPSFPTVPTWTRLFSNCKLSGRSNVAIVLRDSLARLPSQVFLRVGVSAATATPSH